MSASRKSYTAGFKVQVVSYAKKHGNRPAARHHHVDEKMVRDWRKDEDVLVKMTKSKKSNRYRKAKWPEFEDALKAWVLKQRNVHGYVSTKDIRIKAVRMAREQELYDFLGGGSWCIRFMKRQGLTERFTSTSIPSPPQEADEIRGTEDAKTDEKEGSTMPSSRPQRSASKAALDKIQKHWLPEKRETESPSPPPSPKSPSNKSKRLSKDGKGSAKKETGSARKETGSAKKETKCKIIHACDADSLLMECEEEELSSAQVLAFKLAMEEHEKANQLIKAARAGKTLVPTSQPNTFTVVAAKTWLPPQTPQQKSPQLQSPQPQTQQLQNPPLQSQPSTPLTQTSQTILQLPQTFLSNSIVVPVTTVKNKMTGSPVSMATMPANSSALAMAMPPPRSLEFLNIRQNHGSAAKNQRDSPDVIVIDDTPSLSTNSAEPPPRSAQGTPTSPQATPTCQAIMKNILTSPMIPPKGLQWIIRPQLIGQPGVLNFQQGSPHAQSPENWERKREKPCLESTRVPKMNMSRTYGPNIRLSATKVHCDCSRHQGRNCKSICGLTTLKKGQSSRQSKCCKENVADDGISCSEFRKTLEMSDEKCCLASKCGKGANSVTNESVMINESTVTNESVVTNGSNSICDNKTCLLTMRKMRIQNSRREFLNMNVFEKPSCFSLDTDDIDVDSENDSSSGDRNKLKSETDHTCDFCKDGDKAKEDEIDCEEITKSGQMAEKELENDDRGVSSLQSMDEAEDGFVGRLCQVGFDKFSRALFQELQDLTENPIECQSLKCKKFYWSKKRHSQAKKSPFKAYTDISNKRHDVFKAKSDIHKKLEGVLKAKSDTCKRLDDLVLRREPGSNTGCKPPTNLPQYTYQPQNCADTWQEEHFQGLNVLGDQSLGEISSSKVMFQKQFLRRRRENLLTSLTSSVSDDGMLLLSEDFAEIQHESFTYHVSENVFLPSRQSVSTCTAWMCGDEKVMKEAQTKTVKDAQTKTVKDALVITEQNQQIVKCGDTFNTRSDIGNVNFPSESENLISVMSANNGNAKNSGNTNIDFKADMCKESVNSRLYQENHTEKENDDDEETDTSCLKSGISDTYSTIPNMVTATSKEGSDTNDTNMKNVTSTPANNQKTCYTNPVADNVKELLKKLSEEKLGIKGTENQQILLGRKSCLNLGILDKEASDIDNTIATSKECTDAQTEPAELAATLNKVKEQLRKKLLKKHVKEQLRKVCKKNQKAKKTGHCDAAQRWIKATIAKNTDVTDAVITPNLLFNLESMNDEACDVVNITAAPTPNGGNNTEDQKIGTSTNTCPVMGLDSFHVTVDECTNEQNEIIINQQEANTSSEIPKTGNEGLAISCDNQDSVINQIIQSDKVCIIMLCKHYGVSKMSKVLKIPKRQLLQWCRFYRYASRGNVPCGREYDPNIEESWLKQNYPDLYEHAERLFAENNDICDMSNFESTDSDESFSSHDSDVCNQSNVDSEADKESCAPGSKAKLFLISLDKGGPGRIQMVQASALTALSKISTPQNPQNQKGSGSKPVLIFGENSSQNQKSVQLSKKENLKKNKGSNEQNCAMSDNETGRNKDRTTNSESDEAKIKQNHRLENVDKDCSDMKQSPAFTKKIDDIFIGKDQELCANTRKPDNVFVIDPIEANDCENGNDLEERRLVIDLETSTDQINDKLSKTAINTSRHVENEKNIEHNTGDLKSSGDITNQPLSLTCQQKIVCMEHDYVRNIQPDLQPVQSQTGHGNGAKRAKRLKETKTSGSIKKVPTKKNHTVQSSKSTKQKAKNKSSKQVELLKSKCTRSRSSLQGNQQKASVTDSLHVRLRSSKPLPVKDGSLVTKFTQNISIEMLTLNEEMLAEIEQRQIANSLDKVKGRKPPCFNFTEMCFLALLSYKDNIENVCKRFKLSWNMVVKFRKLLKHKLGYSSLELRRTAYKNLLDWDPVIVAKHLNILGKDVVQKLSGIDCSILEEFCRVHAMNVQRNNKEVVDNNGANPNHTQSDRKEKSGTQVNSSEKDTDVTAEGEKNKLSREKMPHESRLLLPAEIKEEPQDDGYEIAQGKQRATLREAEKFRKDDNGAPRKDMPYRTLIGDIGVISAGIGDGAGNQSKESGAGNVFRADRMSATQGSSNQYVYQYNSGSGSSQNLLPLSRSGRQEIIIVRPPPGVSVSNTRMQSLLQPRFPSSNPIHRRILSVPLSVQSGSVGVQPSGQQEIIVAPHLPVSVGLLPASLYKSQGVSSTSVLSPPIRSLLKTSTVTSLATPQPVRFALTTIPTVASVSSASFRQGLMEEIPAQQQPVKQRILEDDVDAQQPLDQDKLAAKQYLPSQETSPAIAQSSSQDETKKNIDKPTPKSLKELNIHISQKDIETELTLKKALLSMKRRKHSSEFVVVSQNKDPSENLIAQSKEPENRALNPSLDMVRPQETSRIQDLIKSVASRTSSPHVIKPAEIMTDNSGAQRAATVKPAASGRLESLIQNMATRTGGRLPSKDTVELSRDPNQAQTSSPEGQKVTSGVDSLTSSDRILSLSSEKADSYKIDHNQSQMKAEEETGPIDLSMNSKTVEKENEKSDQTEDLLRNLSQHNGLADCESKQAESLSISNSTLANRLQTANRVSSKNIFRPNPTICRIESLIKSVSGRVRVPVEELGKQPAAVQAEEKQGETSIFSEAHKSLDLLLGLNEAHSGKVHSTTKMTTEHKPNYGSVEASLVQHDDGNDDDDDDDAESSEGETEDDFMTADSGSDSADGSEDEDTDESDEEEDGQVTTTGILGKETEQRKQIVRESESNSISSDIEDETSQSESSFILENENFDDDEITVDENINLSEKLKSLLNADIFSTINNEDSEVSEEPLGLKTSFAEPVSTPAVQVNVSDKSSTSKREFPKAFPTSVAMSKDIKAKDQANSSGNKAQSKINTSSDASGIVSKSSVSKRAHVKYPLSIKQKIAKIAAVNMQKRKEVVEKYNLNMKSVLRWKKVYGNNEIDSYKLTPEEEKMLEDQANLKSQLQYSEYQIYIDNPEPDGSSSETAALPPSSPAKLTTAMTGAEKAVTESWVLPKLQTDVSDLSTSQVSHPTETDKTSIAKEQDKAMKASPQKVVPNILRKSKSPIAGNSPEKTKPTQGAQRKSPSVPLYLLAPETMTDEAKAKLRQQLLNEGKAKNNKCAFMPTEMVQTEENKAKRNVFLPFDTISDKMKSSNNLSVFLQPSSSTSAVEQEKSSVFKPSDEASIAITESKIKPSSEIFKLSQTSEPVRKSTYFAKESDTSAVYLCPNDGIFKYNIPKKDPSTYVVKPIVDAAINKPTVVPQDADIQVPSSTSLSFEHNYTLSVENVEGPPLEEDGKHSHAFKMAVIKEAQKSGFTNTAKWYHVPVSTILKWHDQFVQNPPDSIVETTTQVSQEIAKTTSPVFENIPPPRHITTADAHPTSLNRENLRIPNFSQRKSTEAEMPKSQLTKQRTRMGPNSIKYSDQGSAYKAAPRPVSSAMPTEYAADVAGDLGTMPRLVKSSANSNEVEIASTWKQVQSLLHPTKTAVRKYSQEYKNKIIKECIERGQKAVARDHSLPYNEISRWRLEAKKNPSAFRPVPKLKTADSARKPKKTEADLTHARLVMPPPGTHNKPIKLVIKLNTNNAEVLPPRQDSSKDLEIADRVADIAASTDTDIAKKKEDRFSSKAVSAEAGLAKKKEDRTPGIAASAEAGLAKKKEQDQIRHERRSLDKEATGINIIGEPERIDASAEENADLRMEVINYCFQYGVLKTQKKFGATRQSIIDLMKEYDELNKYSADAYNQSQGFKTKLISRDKTSVEDLNTETPVVVSNLKDYIVTPEYIANVVDYAEVHGITAATRKFKRKTATVRHWMNQAKKKTSGHSGPEANNQQANKGKTDEQQELLNRRKMEVGLYAKEFGVYAATKRYRKKPSVIKSYMAHYARNVRMADAENQTPAETIILDSPEKLTCPQDSPVKSQKQKTPPKSPIWDQEFVIKPSTNKGPLKLTLSPRRKSSAVNISSADSEEDVNDFGSEDDGEGETGFEVFASWVIGDDVKKTHVEDKNETIVVVDEDKVKTKPQDVVVIEGENTEAIKKGDDLAKAVRQVEGTIQRVGQKDEKPKRELIITATDVPNIFEEDDYLPEDIEDDESGVLPDVEAHVIEETSNTNDESSLDNEITDISEEVNNDKVQQDMPKDENVVELESIKGGDDDVEMIPYEESIMFKLLIPEVDQLFSDDLPVLSVEQAQKKVQKAEKEAKDANAKHISVVKKTKRFADVEIIMNLDDNFLYTTSRSAKLESEQPKEENIDNVENEETEEQMETKVIDEGVSQTGVEEQHTAVSNKNTDPTVQAEPDAKAGTAKAGERNIFDTERSLFEFFQFSDQDEETPKIDTTDKKQEPTSADANNEIKVEDSQSVNITDENKPATFETPEKVETENVRTTRSSAAKDEAKKQSGDPGKESTEDKTKPEPVLRDPSKNLFGSLFKTFKISGKSSESSNTSSAISPVKPEVPLDRSVPVKEEPAKDRSERNLFDFMIPSATQSQISKPVISHPVKVQVEMTKDDKTDAVKKVIATSPFKVKPMFKLPKLPLSVSFGNIAKLGIMKMKSEAKEKTEVVAEERIEKSKGPDSKEQELDLVTNKDLTIVTPQGSHKEKETENDHNTCHQVKRSQDGQQQTIKDDRSEEKVPHFNEPSVVMETFEELRKRLAKERAAAKLDKEAKSENNDDGDGSGDQQNDQSRKKDEMKEDKADGGDDMGNENKDGAKEERRTESMDGPDDHLDQQDDAKDKVVTEDISDQFKEGLSTENKMAENDVKNLNQCNEEAEKGDTTDQQIDEIDGNTPVIKKRSGEKDTSSVLQINMIPSGCTSQEHSPVIPRSSETSTVETVANTFAEYEMYRDFTPQKIVLILDIAKKHGIEFASTSFGLPASVIVNWTIEKDRKQRKCTTSVTLEEKLRAVMNAEKVESSGSQEQTGDNEDLLAQWQKEIGWLLKSKGMHEVLDKWKDIDGVEVEMSSVVEQKTSEAFDKDEKTEKEPVEVDKSNDLLIESSSNENLLPKGETIVEVATAEEGNNIDCAEVEGRGSTEKSASAFDGKEAMDTDSKAKVPDVLSFVLNVHPRDYTVEQKAIIVLLQDKYGLKEVHNKFGINKGTLWTWKNQNRLVKQYIIEQTTGKRTKKRIALEKQKSDVVSETKLTNKNVSSPSISALSTTPSNNQLQSNEKNVRKSKPALKLAMPFPKEKTAVHKGYRLISPTKLPDVLQDARKIPTKEFTLEQRVAIVKLVELYGVRTVHKQFRIPSGSIWNWQHNKDILDRIRKEETAPMTAAKQLNFEEVSDEPITIDTILDRALVAVDMVDHLKFTVDQKVDMVCLCRHFGLAYVCEKMPQVPRGTIWNWCHNKLLEAYVAKRMERVVSASASGSHAVDSDLVDKARMTEQWLSACQSQRPTKRTLRLCDQDGGSSPKSKKLKADFVWDSVTSPLAMAGAVQELEDYNNSVSSLSSTGSGVSDFEEILSEDDVKTVSTRSKRSEISQQHSLAGNKGWKGGQGNDGVGSKGKQLSLMQGLFGAASGVGGVKSVGAAESCAVGVKYIEELEEVPRIEYEVTHIEHGRDGRLMVCYLEKSLHSENATGSMPESATRPKSPESAKKKVPKPKQMLVQHQQKTDGNWVPLDEYYYGTQEGNPQYEEEKGEYRFKCWYCSKMLYNNVRAMQHIQGHIHSSKHQNIDLSDLTQCKHCFKQFDTPFEMQTHVEKVHLSNKVLMCRICEKEMSSSMDLANHMNTNHYACEMPYCCQLCSFRSSMYSDVVDHFKKKHDSSTHLLCLYCLRTFDVKFVAQGWGQTQTYYGHLLKHQSKSSSRKCSVCRLVFFNTKDVRNHRRATHGSNMRDVQGISGAKYASNDPVMIKVPDSGLPQKKKTSQPKSLNAPSISKIQDYGDVQLPAATATSRCVECRMFMASPHHYKKHINCSMCRFATSCSIAYANHMMGFHSGQMTSLNLNIPWERAMPDNVYCLCGYCTKYGNKMANHLVVCLKGSCLKQKPTITAAAGKPQDKEEGTSEKLLGMLGLVQKKTVTTRIRSSSSDKKDDDVPEKKKRKLSESDEVIVLGIEAATGSSKIGPKSSKRPQTSKRTVIKEKPKPETKPVEAQVKVVNNESKPIEIDDDDDDDNEAKDKVVEVKGDETEAVDIGRKIGETEIDKKDKSMDVDKDDKVELKKDVDKEKDEKDGMKDSEGMEKDAEGCETLKAEAKEEIKSALKKMKEVLGQKKDADNEKKEALSEVEKTKSDKVKSEKDGDTVQLEENTKSTDDIADKSNLKNTKESKMDTMEIDDVQSEDSNTDTTESAKLTTEKANSEKDDMNVDEEKETTHEAETKPLDSNKSEEKAEKKDQEQKKMDADSSEKANEKSETKKDEEDAVMTDIKENRETEKVPKLEDTDTSNIAAEDSEKPKESAVCSEKEKDEKVEASTHEAKMDVEATEHDECPTKKEETDLKEKEKVNLDQDKETTEIVETKEEEMVEGKEKDHRKSETSSAERSHDSRDKSRDSRERSHDSHESSRDYRDRSHDSRGTSHDSRGRSHDNKDRSHDAQDRHHDDRSHSDRSSAGSTSHQRDNRDRSYNRDHHGRDNRDHHGRDNYNRDNRHGGYQGNRGNQSSGFRGQHHQQQGQRGGYHGNQDWNRDRNYGNRGGYNQRGGYRGGRGGGYY